MASIRPTVSLHVSGSASDAGKADSSSRRISDLARACMRNVPSHVNGL